MALGGTTLAFVINALTFLVIAWILWGLPPSANVAPGRRTRRTDETGPRRPAILRPRRRRGRTVAPGPDRGAIAVALRRLRDRRWGRHADRDHRDGRPHGRRGGDGLSQRCDRDRGRDRCGRGRSPRAPAQPPPADAARGGGDGRRRRVLGLATELVVAMAAITSSRRATSSSRSRAPRCSSASRRMPSVAGPWG